MKFIRSISDIHLDFEFADFSKRKMVNQKNIWIPSALPTDKDTVLVIPGDLWNSDKFLEHDNENWLKGVAQQFHSVVFVLGNHDYWKDNISFLPKKIYKKVKYHKMDNVYFLHNDSVIIDRVCFIGATLWTDFNGGDLVAMFEAEKRMNDFKKIRTGLIYKKISATDILTEHYISKKYIFSEVNRAFKNPNVDKIVVVSHHAPSILSCQPKYRNKDNPLIYSYVSSLEKDIANSPINFWFHGHVHCVKEYCLGKTKIIVNAKGYKNIEKTFYNERKLFCVKGNNKKLKF